MSKFLAILNLLLVGGVLTAQDSKPLPAPSSPGKAIEGAARASARDRVKTGLVEILSDPQGLDFGPYLKEILSRVRGNWYAHIPEEASAKKGRLAIEFAVLKDGKLASMKLVATSGDVSLEIGQPGTGFEARTPCPDYPSRSADLISRSAFGSITTRTRPISIKRGPILLTPSSMLS